MLRYFTFALFLVSLSVQARAGITWSGDITPIDPTTWDSSTVSLVGNTGAGSVMVDGGSDLESLATAIGFSSTATGQVTVDGMGSTWTMSELVAVGNEGDGTLAITNGGNVSSLDGVVGTVSNSTGLATIDGPNSIWTNGGLVIIGRQGDGTVEITSGGSFSSSFGDIGRDQGSSGNVIVSGTGSNWVGNTRLQVGLSGNGTLEISNGGTVDNINSDIGKDSGSVGEVNVSGFDSKWTGNSVLRVGVEGQATLNITSGGEVESFVVVIGELAGSSGQVTIGGANSKWTSDLSLSIGEAGTGTVNLLTGGTLQVDGNLNIGPQGTLFVANGANPILNSIVLEGGTYESEPIVVVPADKLIQGEGTVDGRVRLDVDGTITALGDLALGDSNSSDGFVFEGNLNVGNNTVTLHDSDLGRLGLMTTISGGTLHASNGVSIGRTNGQSELLSGNGTVRGRIFVGEGGRVEFDGLLDGNVEILGGGEMQLAGEITSFVDVEPGGVITATGDLEMGHSSFNFGFINLGTVNGGNHEVTLRDSTTARVGNMTLAGGKFISQNGFLLEANDSISGHGQFDGLIDARAGSTITATGALTLGNATSATGFLSTGNLEVGNHVVTLLDSNSAWLGSSTMLAGGTIIADNGVSLGAGEMLTGSGVIDGSVNVGVGGSIVAEGDLTMGDTDPVNGHFSSQGELHVSMHSVVLKDSSEATLGNLTTIEGGTLHVATSTSSGIGFLKLGAGDELRGHGTVNAFIKVDAGGEIFASDTLDLGNGSTFFGFESDGLLDVGSHTVTLHDQTVAQLGSMTSLHGGTLIANNGFLLIPGGEVVGDGTIQGDVQSAGSFSPGASPGLLTVEGNYTQVADNVITFQDGSLVIELGGTTPITEHDILEVTGTATLGGELFVDLIDLGGGAFAPQMGDQFTILTAEGGVTNEFDIENLPLLSGVLGWNVFYEPTSVVLEVVQSSLIGDFDNDGDIDGADFLKWQRGESPDPLSSGDLIAWQANFGTVSPITASSTTIPEPSAWLLLTLGIAAVLAGSRRSIQIALQF